MGVSCLVMFAAMSKFLQGSSKQPFMANFIKDSLTTYSNQ